MKWGSREPSRIDDSRIAIIVIALLLIVLYIAAFLLFAPRQATAGDVVNFRCARRTANNKITTRLSAPVAILVCEITAYSPTVAECDASPFITASGKRVYVGGIAADLRIFPFGSTVVIPNYNDNQPCTVIDTGGAIKGNKLDVFFWLSEDAVKWGRRKHVRVEVLYIPKAMP